MLCVLVFDNITDTNLWVQVQEQGMRALCAAYRCLEMSAASKLLGLHCLQLTDTDLHVISLAKTAAECGNVHARKAVDAWQKGGINQLMFRG